MAEDNNMGAEREEYKLNKTGAEIDLILEKARVLSNITDVNHGLTLTDTGTLMNTKSFIPYAELHSKGNFLYTIKYDGINEDWTLNYLEESNNNINAGEGGCSGVCKGNFVGRNYDWLYNNQAYFYICVEETPNHYAYHGMASYANITDAVAQKAIFHEGELSDNELIDFRILPFFVKDGENDYGLYIQINVTPLRPDEDITITRTGAIADVCERNLPAYLLAHCKNIDEVKIMLSSKLNIYPSEELSAEHNFKCHYLITDGTDTIVVEFVDGDVQFIDASYFTNFGLDGVTLPSNKKVPTPGNGVATSIGIYDYGSGLERWNLIVDNYNNITNANQMRSLMNNLLYSNAYTYRDNPDYIWYTEFVSEEYGITVDSPRSNYQIILEAAAAAYQNRDRDNPLVWITAYSVVYDLENKTMNIVSQENTSIEYTFKLNSVRTLLKEYLSV